MTSEPPVVESPALVASVRAHSGEVTCAAARGASLVSGGGDRALRLWHWEPALAWLERALVPNAHRYGVTSVRWSPGGALVASSGVDGAVRVWSARSLTARRVLAAPGGAAARSLCWAGAGRLLAGHDDGALRVWHVPRAVLLARLHAHEGALHAVAAPARGALLLTACTDGVLKVFDLAEVCRSGAEGQPPPEALTWVDGAHDLGALCAATRDDGVLCATGGHDARVRVWCAVDTRPRRLEAVATLEGHAAAVTALSWARRLLASASLDRTARLWAPDAACCLHVVHAHSRYLTCVVLAPDLRYMITGSNDKFVRTWSLGTLTLDDELETPCAALAHFALGDLEGIGPVDSEDSSTTNSTMDAYLTAGAENSDANAAECVWREPVHSAAINCIAAHGDLLATASSDGVVKIYRWSEEAGEAREEHALEAHSYPALAVDFGAEGALLLSAGLDGFACVWDVQSGCLLRSLSAACSGAAPEPGGGVEGDAGGGGVRGAAVSPHHPPLLLLATDDGLAPLWSLGQADPMPAHVYGAGGGAEAATCCAWGAEGRVAATGAAGGALRLHAPPPNPRTLYHHPDAHDLGVQSCDFAQQGWRDEEGGESYLLATAGSDGFLKVWVVRYQEEEEDASVTAELVQQVEAHGGGVSSCRWGRGQGRAGAGAGDCLLLSTAGADRWARVWRVEGRGARLEAAGAVDASEAGGALAVALLGDQSGGTLLAVGALAGELALWRLALAGAGAAEADDAALDVDEDAGAAPRFWGEAGVTRWLREYVTRAPGCSVSLAAERALCARAREGGVTGARLLDDALPDLLHRLGCDEAGDDEEHATRTRLLDELVWLRRAPPPLELESSAPHALLCAASHALMHEPARAADGFTYDRHAIHECFIAAEGAVSPVTGRRLRNACVLPNYGVRQRLQAFLAEHAPPAAAAAPDPPRAHAADAIDDQDAAPPPASPSEPELERDSEAELQEPDPEPSPDD